MSDNEEGVWLDNHECIGEDLGGCSSSDNLGIYEKPDGSIDGFCRTPRCGYKSNNTLAGTYLAEVYGIKKINRSRDKVEEEKTKPRRRRKEKATKKVLSHDEVKKIAAKTSAKGRGFRGQCDDVLKTYNIRTEFDEDSGAVSNRWYPIWKMSEDKKFPVGFKKRIVLPKKDFRVVGLNDPTVDLLGEKECLGSGKWIMLQAGEEDFAAAIKMIDMQSKANHAPIDVVTSTLSETSQYKQIQNKYDFFDGYDNIVICMDEDAAGDSATERLLEILPTGKVKVMTGAKGDANDYLIAKLSKEWYSNFYDAKKPKIAGIVSSLDVHQRLLDICDMPVIPLPPFMRKANNMLTGGLPRGEIINILAGSGIGKTTMVNEFVYYWIRNSPAKVGILSMEAGSGKYWEKLLSRHIGNNISRMGDVDENGDFLATRNTKREYLNSPEVLAAVKDLTEKDGEETFSLIDERGDLETIQEVKQKISQIIQACGCEVIVLDPVQDVLDSLPIEIQAEFCGWLKKMKSKGTTFILINHARKGAGGQKSASRGAELDEQDMQGTSALFKTGAVNIIMTRDKEHEDADERNTTTVRISKNRDGAETGAAGKIFYEFKTHMLHNKDDWDRDNTEGY
jgi:twinkle protein